MSEALIVAVTTAVVGVVLGAVFRDDLVVFGKRAALGGKALLLTPTVVRHLLAWVRQRWRIATMNPRDLDWNLNRAYYIIHLHAQAPADERTLDSIASTMANAGVAPKATVARAMEEHGHHDRFYWPDDIQAKIDETLADMDGDGDGE